MQTYIFIGGNLDGLTAPLPDEPESIKLPDNDLNKVVYVRDTLSVDGASITFYRYEDLTPSQVLNKLLEYYKAWVVYRPGSRW